MSDEHLTLREDYDLWQGLLKHPKWKLLEEFAAQQVTARTTNVMNGLDSTREEDKQRGEVLGIGLFVNYPKLVIEQLEIELDMANKES